MGILFLAFAVAVVVLGLERNARHVRRQLPTAPGWSGTHERRDRDSERLREELRSRA